MASVKNNTNQQLLSKREHLLKKLKAFEKEAIDINTGKFPGGVIIDTFMARDYNDLVTDLIDVLMETIKRPEWLEELKGGNK